ncbi:hypothetical protein NEILACOT_04835 [Neisseria lactamica ATCC 23970]|uniref:Uncharacterized protein n=1 Tax=Neisseria lactamica ATCC 23970 TaxID=546265 RepID=D0WBB0_NEILA|nr:hypothetical protein NEILACOT_04835 [Neisseria lactamica ATCC 23970]
MWVYGVYSSCVHSAIRNMGRQARFGFYCPGTCYFKAVQTGRANHNGCN